MEPGATGPVKLAATGRVSKSHHGYYPLVETIALAIDRPAAEWQKASAREAVHPGRLHSGTEAGFKSEWWARSFVTTGDIISVCLGDIIGIRTLTTSVSR